MSSDDQNTARDTSAPGQLLGYSLQYDRVMYHLLTSKSGSVVSMECFSDVGVENPDNTFIAEEDKSSIDGNPLSNRSVALWKSLANWAEKVLAGELDPKHTAFIIWVAKPCEGPFAKQLQAAGTPSDAKIAIESILAELRDGKPDFSALGKTVREHVQRFATQFEKDRDLVLSMLSHFQYQCGSGEVLGDIRKYFSEHQVVRRSIELDMIYYGLGWLTRRINQSISDGKDARISREDLIEELKAYEQRVGAHNVLEAFDYPVSDKDSENEMAHRIYVQQLRYVEFTQDEILRAIQDKLCASATRTHWIEAERIHEQGLRNFAASLERRWQNVKDRAARVHRDLTRVDQGRVIYSDCTTDGLRIENMDVPVGFVPGSYHELADDETVWWHPDYHSLKQNDRDQEANQ